MSSSPSNSPSRTPKSNERNRVLGNHRRTKSGVGARVASHEENEDEFNEPPRNPVPNLTWGTAENEEKANECAHFLPQKWRKNMCQNCMLHQKTHSAAALKKGDDSEKVFSRLS